MPLHNSTPSSMTSLNGQTQILTRTGTTQAEPHLMHASQFRERLPVTAMDALTTMEIPSLTLMFFGLACKEPTLAQA